jgi:hypothetical protein
MIVSSGDIMLSLIGDSSALAQGSHTNYFVLGYLFCSIAVNELLRLYPLAHLAAKYCEGVMAFTTICCVSKVSEYSRMIKTQKKEMYSHGAET